jgi:hypothetical protein
VRVLLCLFEGNGSTKSKFLDTGYSLGLQNDLALRWWR